GIALGGIGRLLTTNETVRPEVRAAAEAFFGARVFDCYSSGEMGIVALDCPTGGVRHVMAETVMMEVLNDEGTPCAPGETGRVILTDLSNFASPLIRYDTTDYAELAGPCACGRGLPALARIVGRERNLLRRPDGARYWPRMSSSRYGKVAPVVEHQLI